MTDKLTEMWAAFEAYQPTADKNGHGISWRVMCRERTRDAADAARAAAWDAARDAQRKRFIEIFCNEEVKP